jgi:hypothetical protein
MDPNPHTEEHKPGDRQPSILQSTGWDELCAVQAHGAVLQPAVSVREPHCGPPAAAELTTVRMRSLKPPPQAAVHIPHAPQAESSHGIGQGRKSHESARRRGGHSSPPCAGAVCTTREQLLKPPPQVCEHALQPPHSDTSQCTAHGCRLHGRCSLTARQPAPPWSGEAVMTR